MQGWKRVRENSVVPPGLESLLPLSPALKRWAKLDRPSGAGFLWSFFHLPPIQPHKVNFVAAAARAGHPRDNRQRAGATVEGAMVDDRFRRNRSRGRSEGIKRVRSGRRVRCAQRQASTGWASEQGIGGKVEGTLRLWVIWRGHGNRNQNRYKWEAQGSGRQRPDLLEGAQDREGSPIKVFYEG